jgi:hypothetical protein
VPVLVTAAHRLGSTAQGAARPLREGTLPVADMRVGARIERDCAAHPSELLLGCIEFISTTATSRPKLL